MVGGWCTPSYYTPSVMRSMRSTRQSLWNPPRPRRPGAAAATPMVLPGSHLAALISSVGLGPRIVAPG